MKKMYLTIAAVSMLGTFAAAQTPTVNPTVAIADRCMVSLEPISGQSQVPAQEAGVLKDIKVREGQQVRTGDLLVQIDDAQAQEQLKNARAEFARPKSRRKTTSNCATPRKPPMSPNSPTKSKSSRTTWCTAP